MSHFSVLVITDKTKIDSTSGESLVLDLLAPYDENGQWGREGSRWDWYLVGGRWEGDLGTYDPSQDSRNYSKCDLCNGTNIRADRVGSPAGKDWCNGCVESDIEKAKDATLKNGFKLLGMSRNFGNVSTDGNVKFIRDIRPDFEPHAFLTPDDGWVESARMGMFASTSDENDEFGDQWKQAVEKYADRVAVLVDCHV